MLQQVLLLGYYLILFIFGIVMSFVFCNVNPFESKQKPLIYLSLYSLLAQLLCWLILGEELTWKLYPILAHMPIIFVLCKYYNQKIFDALISVSIAYFLCQPSKWLGLLMGEITNNGGLELMIRVIVLLGLGYYIMRMIYSMDYHILNHNIKWKIAFCIVPMVYYVYDYVTSYITINSNAISEFLPFVLCCSYFHFLLSYQIEYEQKMEAKQNAELNSVILKQQKKELEAIKKSNEEVQLLRHDMRHLINNVVYLLAENQTDAALKMLNKHNQAIEATYIKYYCDNEMLNYIISDFASRCKKEDIPFETDIKLMTSLNIDETILISILSNGLENAINAQKGLNKEDKKISLYLKTKEDKLLLSIKNPFDQKPIFDEGMPISTQDGHGYGVKSIKHLTESVGGSCEFLVKDKLFILRLVL